MFAKFKGAIINAVNNLEGTSHFASGSIPSIIPDTVSSTHLNYLDRGPPLKYAYGRPAFLQLNTDDEVQVTADHSVRPIIVPRDVSQLPWNAGYAECINGGKSSRNEDQAASFSSVLRPVMCKETIGHKVADMLPTVPNYRASGAPRPTSRTSEPIPLSTSSNGPFNGNTSQNASSSSLNGSDHGIMNGIDILSPTTPLSLEELILSPGGIEPDITVSSPFSDTQSSVLSTDSLPWTYFGIFDGHAGPGVAVAASKGLHKKIQEKLENISDLLIEFGVNRRLRSDPTQDRETGEQEHKSEDVELDAVNGNGYHTSYDETRLNRVSKVNGSPVINRECYIPQPHGYILFPAAHEKLVTLDSLVIGALESAFWQYDHQIGQDKKVYRMSGGCTVLVSIFILGKLYVSNAGDSRCILLKDSKVSPMSFDFTPESERERVKYLAMLKPELLGTDFTHLEFIRKPTRKDLGKKLLVRDAYMSGWVYKTVQIEDLRFPLVYGDGKRSRVLATIGVTRGFGDHELKAQYSHVDIKPFLTPQPEVKVLDLEKEYDSLTDSDVIIMATDGLWDVTSSEQAGVVVRKSMEDLVKYANGDPESERSHRSKYRYISAAQDLVMSSRGKQREKSKGWRTQDNKTATIDDISVFVIPLLPYAQEWRKWQEARKITVSQGVQPDVITPTK